ncbi:hypothetical protein D3C76_887230 [compost metagenome]
MPASLKEDLEALAKKNRRSLTAEVVARLEKSIAEDEEGPYPGLSELVEDQADHVKPISSVSKERLLATLDDDKPVTKRDIDAAMMDAMMRALDMLDTRKTARQPDQPTQGPAPRKRFPKE